MVTELVCEKHPTRWFWWLLAVVVLAAAILSLGLLNRPQRCDESISYLDYIRHGPGTVIATYRAPNNHVFYNLLACLTTVGTPFQPWSQRLIAWFAGLGTILLTGIVGRQIADARAGLYAALILAFNAILLDYMANARGYTITALATVALLGFTEAWSRNAARRNWLAFGSILVGALALWTVPIMLYALAGIYLYGVANIWIRKDSSAQALYDIVKLVWVPVGIVLLSLLFYTPILVSEGWSALVSNEFVTGMQADHFEGKLSELIFALLKIGFGWSPTGAAVLGILALVGLFQLRKGAIRFVWLMATFIIGASFVTVVVFAIPPGRVFIYLTPVIAITAGAGISEVLKRLSLLVQASVVAVGAGILGYVILFSHSRDGELPYAIPIVGLPEVAEVIRLIEQQEDPSTETINLLSGSGSKPVLDYEILRRASSINVVMDSASPVWIVQRDHPMDTLEHITRMRGVHLPALEEIEEVQHYRIGALTVWRLPAGSMVLGRKDDAWPDAESIGHFTRKSSWFGTFMEYDFPWLRHEVHGWILFGGGSSDSFWIWDKSLGIWWNSGKSLYPWIRIGKEAPRDLYVDLSTKAPNRRFWDAQSDSWLNEDALRTKDYIE